MSLLVLLRTLLLVVYGSLFKSTVQRDEYHNGCVVGLQCK